MSRAAPSPSWFLRWRGRVAFALGLYASGYGTLQARGENDLSGSSIPISSPLLAPPPWVGGFVGRHSWHGRNTHASQTKCHPQLSNPHKPGTSFPAAQEPAAEPALLLGEANSGGAWTQQAAGQTEELLAKGGVISPSSASWSANCTRPISNIWSHIFFSSSKANLVPEQALGA